VLSGKRPAPPQLITKHLVYNPRRQSESNTSKSDIQQHQPELLSVHIDTAVSSSTTEQINTMFRDCDRATFTHDFDLSMTVTITCCYKVSNRICSCTNLVKIIQSDLRNTYKQQTSLRYWNPPPTQIHPPLQTVWHTPMWSESVPLNCSIQVLKVPKWTPLFRAAVPLHSGCYNRHTSIQTQSVQKQNFQRQHWPNVMLICLFIN